MSFFNSIDISASGLTAQRLRMDLISQNLANAETTKTENGKPYRRKVAVFKEKQYQPSFSQYLTQESKARLYRNNSGGVRVTKIIEDKSPLRKVYKPAHPDADEKGYVNMPNVNIMQEMVNMISATRSYEANVMAINSSKNMAIRALEIGS